LEASVFQLAKIHHEAEAALDLTVSDMQGANGDDLALLERRVDAQMRSVRSERQRIAARRGRLWALAEATDRRTRTDAMERFDDPDLSDDRRVKLATDLHRFNQITQAYWRFLRVLRPIVAAVRPAGRPVRILELASGSGGFARALAARASAAGLEVEVRGSDVQPSQVAAANQVAERTGSPVRFAVLDAFQLDKVPAGQADIVFIALAVHHFTPGQLARMVRGATRLATHAVVLVDGHRSAFLCGFVPGLALFSGNPDFVHDGFVTARKLYSLPELCMVARLACPECSVSGRLDWPGYSVVEVSARP
jgi:SAM-dependent methyltransferase